MGAEATGCAAVLPHPWKPYEVLRSESWVVTNSESEAIADWDSPTP